MKRILFYAVMATLTGLTALSCGKTDKEFNKEFLYGEWSYTTDVGDGPEEIHDVFRADGTGTTKFITNGSPSQSFTWTLEGSTLTFYRETTNNTRAVVPKDYTVEKLTQTELVYRNSFGTTRCTKI